MFDYYVGQMWLTTRFDIALTLRFLSHMKTQSRISPGLVTQWFNDIMTPAQQLCDFL